MKRIGNDTKKELLGILRKRYGHATKKEKTKILDEFVAISGRKDSEALKEAYKYERSALVLVDLKSNPPTFFKTLDELKEKGYVRPDYNADFQLLSPVNFAKDLLKAHRIRFGNTPI